MSDIHVRLSEDSPEPPSDSDFAIKIDFKKGSGNPRRVFDAISMLIEGFEEFDDATAASIDSKIEPILVLEDIEAGSIKVWLKNILKAIDDDALKDMDWKKAVGKYLVDAKYAALGWLDEGSDENPPRLPDLTNRLTLLAQETDVRYIPDYPPASEGKLLTALDKMQDAKGQLGKRDHLYIESDGRTYEIDLSRTWLPTSTIAPDAMRELVSHGEMILTVRKPDMIGDTQWQFRHGNHNIMAPIHDSTWLDKYHSREIELRPGDALRCRVKFIYDYDSGGQLQSQRIEIEKVLEVIRSWTEQIPLLEDDN